MSELENDIEVTSPMQQSKGPFLGILLFLVGIIIIVASLISSAASSPKTETIEATVSYASILKASADGTTKVQSINVDYTYNGKQYKTGINNIVNGSYNKYDVVKIDIFNNDPINIVIHGSVNNSAQLVPKIFCGIVCIVLGVLLFLSILSVDNIEYRLWKLKKTLLTPSEDTPEGEEPKNIMSTLTGIVDKILGGKKDK